MVNRSMGKDDLYPFVIPPPVLDKLDFVASPRWPRRKIRHWRLERSPTVESMSTTGGYVSSGEFNRDSTTSRTGSPGRARRPEHGPVDGELWPVEPGRYRLVAAKACPWANRAIIVRQLLGLEDVISMGLRGPTHDERSWTFDLDPGGVDPVLGIERLQQAYFARFPDYPRGITVPAIVDVADRRVVTNDFPWITHDFFFEWRDFHRRTRRTCGPPSSATRWRRSCSGSTPRSTTASTAAASPAPRRRTTRRTTGSGRRWTGSRSDSRPGAT